MGRVSIDATLLIDLQRERRLGQAGPAAGVLQTHADEEVQISAVAWGEFLEGFEDLQDLRIERITESMTILSQTDATAKVYSRIARGLRKNGNLIGSNDLWIAATSLEHKLPLITRNGSHFSRVPELQLIEY